MKNPEVNEKVPVKPGRKRRRLLCLSLFGILAVMAATWATQQHVIASAGPFLHDVASVPRAECILVPGARIYSDGKPYPMLVDRLETARRLFEIGKAGSILVSGRGGGGLAVDEVGAMRRWLIEHGIPAAVIEEDHEGMRTIDSLWHCGQDFKHRSVIVASNGFHVPRMVFLGQHFGMKTYGVAATPLSNYSATTLFKNRAREVLARLRACLDVYVLGVS